jgi:hypothetical protein
MLSGCSVPAAAFWLFVAGFRSPAARTLKNTNIRADACNCKLFEKSATTSSGWSLPGAFPEPPVLPAVADLATASGEIGKPAAVRPSTAIIGISEIIDFIRAGCYCNFYGIRKHR